MSRSTKPKIAYITSGAAGMYCGSCMRDNTLAAALQRQSVDILLIPTYTPLLTDETNVSIDQVFFGGINIFLQQKLSLFRRLPRVLDRFLDNPRLIRWATKKATSTNPQTLGDLTVSMLKGRSGYQKKEVDRLCQWLTDSFRPDLINLSNALIAGCIPELKQRLDVPILVTLQGDDIFLEDLPPKFKKQAIDEIKRIDTSIDGYIVFSEYYADFMSRYLGVDRGKMNIVPLGVDVRDFQSISTMSDDDHFGEVADKIFTIGYLARMAPEKGLHLLVDAFIELHQRHQLKHARLELAGWLGEHRQVYVNEQIEKLKRAGLEESYRFWGTVDRAQKADFLKRIDVLSVPTTYLEPKGLFVLEAMAAGVPVVQPNHGAFPELIASTNGGLLCQPNDPSHLADQLAFLINNPAAARDTGLKGRESVLQRRTAEIMAAETLALYSKFLS